jgi:hypothetical protein
MHCLEQQDLRILDLQTITAGRRQDGALEVIHSSCRGLNILHNEVMLRKEKIAVETDMAILLIFYSNR